MHGLVPLQICQFWTFISGRTLRQAALRDWPPSGAPQWGQPCPSHCRAVFVGGGPAHQRLDVCFHALPVVGSAAVSIPDKWLCGRVAAVLLGTHWSPHFGHQLWNPSPGLSPVVHRRFGRGLLSDALPCPHLSNGGAEGSIRGLQALSGPLCFGGGGVGVEEAGGVTGLASPHGLTAFRGQLCVATAPQIPVPPACMPYTYCYMSDAGFVDCTRSHAFFGSLVVGVVRKRPSWPLLASFLPLLQEAAPWCRNSPLAPLQSRLFREPQVQMGQARGARGQAPGASQG